MTIKFNEKHILHSPFLVSVQTSARIGKVALHDVMMSVFDWQTSILNNRFRYKVYGYGQETPQSHTADNQWRGEEVTHTANSHIKLVF